MTERVIATGRPRPNNQPPAQLVEVSPNGCPGWTVTAEEVAESFHRIYEHLAPMFGYETRPESAVTWEKVPENNRRLMVATVQHVLQQWFPAHVGNWLDQGGNWRPDTGSCLGGAK